METLVSIIIPIYNAELYLTRCIESILKQNYGNWELLLVDDGSTDHSGHICDEYAKSNNRIRVFHNQNEGAAAARYYGIKESKGEYFCFVDADDSLPIDSIDLLYENSHKYKADIVVGGYTRLYSNGNTDFCGLSFNQCLGREFLYSLLSGNWKISGPVAKLFRRGLFLEEFPIIPREIRLGEDLLMNACLASQAKSVVFIPFSLYNYHQIETSATHSFIYTIEYVHRYLSLLVQSLEILKVIEREELIYHYKISIMYNVLLDDMSERVNYMQEYPLFNGNLRHPLIFKERLILILLRYRWIRVLYRRLMSKYRNGNGCIYRVVHNSQKLFRLYR